MGMGGREDTEGAPMWRQGRSMYQHNGYVTAVAVGQSRRLYSGVGVFNWYYLSLSSPPQILRFPRCHLESRGLRYKMRCYIIFSTVLALHCCRPQAKVQVQL
jgi:hypothetical protein